MGFSGVEFCVSLVVSLERLRGVHWTGLTPMLSVAFHAWLLVTVTSQTMHLRERLKWWCTLSALISACQILGTLVPLVNTSWDKLAMMLAALLSYAFFLMAIGCIMLVRFRPSTSHENPLCLDSRFMKDQEQPQRSQPQ